MKQEEQHKYDAIQISKTISEVENIKCPKNRAMMKDFLMEVLVIRKGIMLMALGLRYCDLIALAKAVNSDDHITAPFMVHDNLESSEAQSFWQDIRYHWPDGQHLYNVVSKGTPFEAE